MAKRHVPGMPKLMSDRDVNIIRGKALAGAATKDDVMNILGHLLAVETKLDEGDYDDMLGTEGWRHWMGVPGC